MLAVALPVFRPLRVLRVFAASQTIFTRRHGLLASGQAIVVGAVLLVVVAALAMLDAERGAVDATITSFGSALWWGMTTVTTVGYGDTYPVTTTGRIVAAALMLVGISMVGVISASVAAWFVAQTRTAEEGRVNELSAELVALREQLARIERSGGRGPRGWRRGDREARGGSGVGLAQTARVAAQLRHVPGGASRCTAPPRWCRPASTTKVERITPVTVLAVELLLPERAPRGSTRHGRRRSAAGTSCPSASRNFTSLAGVSGLIPRTSRPPPSRSVRLSRKSQACFVHPGVEAAG